MKIYEVAYNLDSDGKYGDGIEVFRTRNQAEAEEFARGRSCYQGGATVETLDVPAKVARRWGF